MLSTLFLNLCFWICVFEFVDNERKLSYNIKYDFVYLLPAGPAVRPLAGLFFDGQNIFYHAKTAFGYSFPNYDPHKLAERICAAQGWQLAVTHFYTGRPLGNRQAFLEPLLDR